MNWNLLSCCFPTEQGVTSKQKQKKKGMGDVVGAGVMRWMARMKDVLLKETASEVSKQTGLSREATGVQSVLLAADRLRHRQP